MPFPLNPTYIHNVTKIHYNDLTEEEIEKDTAISDGGNYNLPQMWLIKIELWTQGQAWSTMRPFNPEKMKYYQSLIGFEIKVEINK